MHVTRWIHHFDWRLLFLIIPSFFLLVFIPFSFTTINPFSSCATFRRIIYNPTIIATTTNCSWSKISSNVNNIEVNESVKKSRIAVCLVGGARRFELTGMSIVENILNIYPNADLFLHSPLDGNAFKLSLLKVAPRIAWVRIFKPEPVLETDEALRVLTANNSPNGIQGLLRYFNLVEGCLTMINEYQKQKNLKYDWIIRTRVDGYWNAPLGTENFIPGQYLVPPGSSYGGLNDRFGLGDLNTSTISLSRLSLIPKLDSSGLTELNSEAAFKAQLTTQSVPYITKRLPFCIVTERKYDFPPSRFGVPVAAMSSPGPLSGVKCRPCTSTCKGRCVGDVMSSLERDWSWTDWENDTLELCVADGEWEEGWVNVFDENAGKKLVDARKMVFDMNLRKCFDDFEEMKRMSFKWEAPPLEEICRLGIVSN